MHRILVTGLAVSSLTLGVSEAGDGWTQIGPGGGGRFRLPAISRDGKKAILATDMGSCFYGDLHNDAFNIVDNTHLAYFYKGGFFYHPTKNDLVFSGSKRGFAVSDNGGKTWSGLQGPWEQVQWDGKWPAPFIGPEIVAFNPNKPATGYAWFENFRHLGKTAMYKSLDYGKNWQAVTLPEFQTGRLRSILYLQDGSSLWGFEKALMRKAPDSDKLVMVKALEGKAKLTAFTGARGKYYAAIAAGSNGYLLISSDGGSNWTRQTVGSDYSMRCMAASQQNPDIVYFCMNVPGRATLGNLGKATVYKTTDGFKTRHQVFFRNPEMKLFNITNPAWTSEAWGWGVIPQDLAVCPTNSDIVMTTDATQAYISRNGGKTWKILATQSAGKGLTYGGGMPVMSAYNYYFDPHNRANRYIAMNDFSNWFSYDGNKTWAQYNKGNKFPHNVYSMVFDPAVPGKIWAGACKSHDFPHWKWLSRNRKLKDLGGVMLSTDYGRTWTMLSNKTGLPVGNVTGLALDPKSPVEARRLWTTIWNKGVFTSSDGGKSWREINKGISTYNRRMFGVTLDKFGRLWTLSSLQGGALYLSADNGENWKMVLRDRNFQMLTKVTPSRKDRNLIYVSSLTNSPMGKGTSIMKSVDGGKTWQPIFKDKACWGVYLHPENEKVVFACTYSDGLWLSRDGGSTWKKVEKFPALSPISVTFDPEDANCLYVNCFGNGVWKGRLD